ncbi:recombinase family protein [[Clostridium] innocuum]|nr:recombinase family protein [[Clostridium] innocuum]
MKAEDLAIILQKAKDACTCLSAQGIDEETLATFYLLIEGSEDFIQKEMTRKEKQRIGIQKAQQKGIRIGRPEIPISNQFLRQELLYSEKTITAREAAKRLNIAVSTFYRMRKKYREERTEWKT